MVLSYEAHSPSPEM